MMVKLHNKYNHRNEQYRTLRLQKRHDVRKDKMYQNKGRSIKIWRPKNSAVANRTKEVNKSG